jgi:hypothetical protein
MVSEGCGLRLDGDQPAQFSNSIKTRLPKGTIMFDPASGQSVPSPFEMSARAVTTARGSFGGSRFSGPFESQMTFKVGAVEIPFLMRGEFSVSLS